MLGPPEGESGELRLIQMAGAPGSGKSTLAAALGRQLGLIVVDKDLVKSALLGQEVAWEAAGRAAGEVCYELARSLLAQGHSVILDGPSHYPEIPVRGLALARGAGARYRLIECVCDDLDEVGRRLASRTRLRSQWSGLDQQAPDGVTSAEPVGPHRWRTYGPPAGWLTVDTRGSLDRPLETAVGYLVGAAD